MKDLILQIRLDAMEMNLKQVKSVIASVQERQDEIFHLYDWLNDNPNNLRTELEIARQGAEASFNRLEGLIRINAELKTSLEPVQTDLKQVLAVIAEADEQAKIAAKIVKEMCERSVSIGKDSGKTLAQNMGSGVTDCMFILDDIRGYLQQAGEAALSGDASRADDLLSKAWGVYSTEMLEKAQAVFTDYVDILRGLALRDAGFDEGIFNIADELIRPYPVTDGLPWSSLTIPAREVVSRTISLIIRLGYPEWTLWALPLTAYEFGHIVAQKNPGIGAFIAKKAEDSPTISKEHLVDYFADALATYLMGPAYASAALLLFFDPVSAYEDKTEHPAFAKRAHVILKMLEQMNERVKDGGSPYLAIIDELREAWQAGLDQNHPQREIDKQEVDELDRIVIDLNRPLDINFEKPYSAWNWASFVQEWKDRLLEDQGKAIQFDGSEDSRDVLNAAWLCRIYNRDVDTRLIADAGFELWKRLMQEKTEKPPKPVGYGRQVKRTVRNG